MVGRKATGIGHLRNGCVNYSVIQLDHIPALFTGLERVIMKLFMVGIADTGIWQGGLVRQLPNLKEARYLPTRRGRRYMVLQSSGW